MATLSAHLSGSLVIVLTSACLVPTVQPGSDDTTTSTSASATEVGTTEQGTTGGASADSADSSGDDSSSSDTSTGSTDDGAMGLPDGALHCVADSDCASGHCFDLSILGTICGECNSDDDCVDVTGFGCSPPDFAGKPYAGATCGDGELGSGCETTDACAVGLTCELVLSVPVISSFRFCSECASHADCDGDMLCEPIIQLTEVTGHWGCVAPGSTPIGESCDHTGDGDLACASGNCAAASLDNLALMGLCSECDADADCPEGWGCQAADIDTAEVVPHPAVCVQRG
jgi:hypothetical protein